MINIQWYATRPISVAPFVEEVVALVVDDDERREVLDLDFPTASIPTSYVKVELRQMQVTIWCRSAPPATYRPGAKLQQRGVVKGGRRGR